MAARVSFILVPSDTPRKGSSNGREQTIIKVSRPFSHLACENGGQYRSGLRISQFREPKVLQAASSKEFTIIVKNLTFLSIENYIVSMKTTLMKN
jgi:hypothetical protein